MNPLECSDWDVQQGAAAGGAGARREATRVEDRGASEGLQRKLLLSLFTIVAISHGPGRLLKKFWLVVVDCFLRNAGSSLIWNYADPLTALELLHYYPTLVRSALFAFMVFSGKKTLVWSKSCIFLIFFLLRHHCCRWKGHGHEIMLKR